MLFVSEFAKMMTKWKSRKGIRIRKTLFSSGTCVHRWTWKSLPLFVDYERNECV